MPIGITKISYNKSDLQSHSRSSTIMSFDSPYRPMISYMSSIVAISCTVSEILLLISKNLKTSRDHNHAPLGEIF